MARENADWIGQIFADLSPSDMSSLMASLAKTKSSARKALDGGARR
jgi:hypothetical protein